MSLRSSTLIVPPIPPLNRGKVADWTTEHNFRSQLHKIVVQTFPHFLRGRSGISRLDAARLGLYAKFLRDLFRSEANFSSEPNPKVTLEQCKAY